jgi:hypothetical protein
MEHCWFIYLDQPGKSDVLRHKINWGYDMQLQNNSIHQAELQETYRKGDNWDWASSQWRLFQQDIETSHLSYEEAGQLAYGSWVLRAP